MQDISPKLVRPVPKLNTGHCVLRLPEPAESPAVVAFLKKNRDHLANAGPAWPDDYLTEAYWVNQLTTNLLEFEEERSVRF
ncbi:MAG TPA: hypothetical protein PKC93_17230, partial [Candidatus Obscuribacter sp.]|nr:hypothetical protein [Candidatus Obscuribacter sp.]